MSTASQLERIAKIVEQLSPLGSKQRGMRIEASEWNQLVAALREVLEIDRAQEVTAQQRLEEGFARNVHEHLGQVDLAWLDSDLQSRLSEGPGSLSTRVAVEDMGRKVDTAAAEVARLSGIVDEQQKRNDSSAVEELERSAKLRGFEQRFAGLEDLRGLVAQLAARAQRLGPVIEAVLELRTSLLDAAGNPIAVNEVAGRVAALEKLSANFNGVDGRPLRLRDIEVQMQELQDGLDARIDQRVRALVDEQVRKNLDQLMEQIGGQLAELQKRFESQLTATRRRLESEVAALSNRVARLEG
jgi:hypothetical protein